VGRTIRGTVVVLDPQGVEHRMEDGSLKLTCFDAANRSLEARVEAGRWSVSLEDARWEGLIEIKELKVGGRTAYADSGLIDIRRDGIATRRVMSRNQGLLRSYGPGEELPLRAWWAGRSVLRVVDQETRRELEEVEVVTAPEDWGGLDHPGSARRRTICSGARSPVELPEGPGRERFWVRAAGHAWQSLSANLQVGGEWVVPLPRCAELEVTLRNLKPSSDVVVRLHRAPRDVCAASQRPSADGIARIADLAPGSYDVRVSPTRSIVVGDWKHTDALPIVLGETKVELLPGGTASVTLALSDPPEPGAKVPLKGVVVFRPGQSDAFQGLDLRAVDPTIRALQGTVSVRRSRTRRPDDPVPFDAGVVHPGRYVVTVHGCVRRTLEVGPGGETNARIEVPELGYRELRFVDRATGEEVRLEDRSASWWSLSEDEEGRERGDVRLDWRTGRHRFWAPVGRVQIGVSDATWSGDATLAIDPGRSEASIALDRMRWLRVAFTDGFAPVSHWAVQSKAQGPGELRGVRPDRRDGTLFGFTRPGRYELFVEPLDGFEPIPPLDVVVPPEGMAERTVRLVRKP
jgi:hypothetical protein